MYAASVCELLNSSQRRQFGYSPKELFMLPVLNSVVIGDYMSGYHSRRTIVVQSNTFKVGVDAKLTMPIRLLFSLLKFDFFSFINNDS